MNFDELFSGKFKLQGGNAQISEVCCKLENCKPGAVFFSLTQDEKKDSEEVQKAIKLGVFAVFSAFSHENENCFCVKDVRKLFALTCKKFNSNACDSLKIVGVTGTNGKTSICHIAGQMLENCGKKVGVIGTSGVKFAGKVLPCPLTTPDADFLHKTFLQMKNAGVEIVIMEVSAHAIVQQRIFGIKFEIGVLTNITQDHLDYFATMENYKNAKLSFFNSEHIRSAIINVDDDFSREALKVCDVPTLTYANANPSDIFAVGVESDFSGSKYLANLCDEILSINTNLKGMFNVENALACMGICHLLGCSAKQIEKSLSFVTPVEGRFNVINFAGRNVVIDYAHSPDGLNRILQAAKKMCKNRLFVVFGCGGQRDRSKRPQMGKIAEKYADFVCLTNDNPRLEDEQKIVLEIEKGMSEPHFVELDRKKAIHKMLKLTSKGDLLVIAGKGAEKVQIIGTKEIAYNDFDVVNEYIGEYNQTKGGEKK